MAHPLETTQAPQENMASNDEASVDSDLMLGPPSGLSQTAVEEEDDKKQKKKKGDDVKLNEKTNDADEDIENKGASNTELEYSSLSYTHACTHICIIYCSPPKDSFRGSPSGGDPSLIAILALLYLPQSAAQAALSLGSKGGNHGPHL